MNILATAVATENGIETVDTIEYAGHLWLVTHWADTADGTMTIPTRLVCLSVNAYRLALDGPSMRDPKTAKAQVMAPVADATNSTADLPRFFGPRLA